MKRTEEPTEYSDNYQFFLEHQVAVSYTNGRKWATVFSLLDGDVFITIKQATPIPNSLLYPAIREAHQGLIFKQKQAS